MFINHFYGFRKCANDFCLYILYTLMSTLYCWLVDEKKQNIYIDGGKFGSISNWWIQFYTFIYIVIVYENVWTRFFLISYSIHAIKNYSVTDCFLFMYGTLKCVWTTVGGFKFSADSFSNKRSRKARCEKGILTAIQTLCILENSLRIVRTLLHVVGRYLL